MQYLSIFTQIFPNIFKFSLKQFIHFSYKHFSFLPSYDHTITSMPQSALLNIQWTIMSCPISRLLVRLPAMNEDFRNSIKLRIIHKQQKLAKLRLSLSQTCQHDTKNRANLSEAIILVKGAIRELKIMLARTPHDQYKLEWAGKYVIHSCLPRPINTAIETIDLTDSANNPEVEIIEDTPGRSSPSL